MKLFSRTTTHGARTVTITGTTKVFEVPGKDSILNEALAAGIPFPHSCTVGTCGTCKSKLVHGKVREIVDSAIALSAQELRDGYILPCQSIARSCIELEVAGLADMPEHPLVHTGAVICAQRSLTHDITEIVLKLDKELDYTAGQYAELRIDGVTGPRSYSFATAPDDANLRRVTFYVRHVPGGQFTDWLFDADRQGTRLQLAGPFGDLWLRPADEPLLCVAGGSGLAPIKALLEDAVRQRCKRHTVLLFGARTQRDLYCLAELDELRRSWNGQFDFHAVLSDEPPESTWSGARGLVTDVLPRLPSQFIGDCHVYTCGPPAMIDALETALRDIRADTEHFYADRFVTRIPGAAQTL
ncbi:MAG: 2Fe-2S iron-sulfur cluster binding domain-containing protein [Mycobacterium sp.]|uniref:2Fe-2S iron-sulfur cluster binding domain-containing protein n=1 Tax=Mycobacterium sp. TaxID=1785 RepID=UPI002603447C|nr:2Fe-2S iron-sulfur cluster binding domain-containing protein [Mycobacterium sp.]MDI3313803.1 2Fe-2S iron-sulfur cluster binding domain-containing protein [Mycobacterium sp.]